MGASQKEFDAGIRIKKIDGLFKLIYLIIRCVTLVLCFCIVERGWVSTVGKTTSASVLVNMALSLGATRWFFAIVALLGGGYGLSERSLRRRHIKKTAEYIEALEKKIDPGRSSSGLTAIGTTRKEDRP